MDSLALGTVDGAGDGMVTIVLDEAVASDAFSEGDRVLLAGDVREVEGED